MSSRDIKIIKPEHLPKQPRLPLHRFYFTFNNLKSAALELAREIEREDGQDTPRDVLHFINEFQGKTTKLKRNES